MSKSKQQDDQIARGFCLVTGKHRGMVTRGGVSTLHALMSTAIVVIILFSGCVRTPSADRALERLRMQAEERLLQDARGAFFLGNYQETALLLDRFLTNHPRSRLTDEARWWLARARQQQGDLREALRRYRQLAKSRHRNPYREEAKLRVAELESVLGVDQERREFVGVMVEVGLLSHPNGVDTLTNYQDHVSAGSVVVDVPCRSPANSDMSADGSLPEAGRWERILSDSVTPLVKLGKERGFGVVLAVPLRCLGRYQNASDEQTNRWREQSYEVNSGRVERSEAYSLFYAEYRDTVFSLLSQVAELRVEGLIFRATGSPGLYDGFTPQAIREFEQKFGERVDPEMLFDVPSGRAVLSAGLPIEPSTGSFNYPPLFWKWVGWKARENFRFMNDLAVHLRSQFPYLKIGVEVHPESIEDPLAALVNVSEDWVEISQGEFDVLVTHGRHLRDLTWQAGISEEGDYDWTTQSSDLVTRMVDHLGNANRVWVIQPRRESRMSYDQEGRTDSEFPKGVGILYDYTVPP